MKFDLVSDLHLEFADCQVPNTGNPVLILAGDIHVGDRATDWINIALKNYDLVIYVLGNHEFYRQDYDRTRKFWVESAKHHDGLSVLDNGVVEYGGVRFIGSTMWTPGLVGGLNDYNLIMYRGSILRVEDTYQMHQDAVRFLKTELSTPFDGETVVVTHHAPIPECVTPKWVGHPGNEMFHANLNKMIAQYKPKYWLHGHMHDSIEFTYLDTRIVCNPRGYVGYGANGGFELPATLTV